MKLLADENLDLTVVARLREAGHQVIAVAEMEPGISDDVVLDRANAEAAMLLTEDKDFGELAFSRILPEGIRQFALRLFLSPFQNLRVSAFIPKSRFSPRPARHQNQIVFPALQQDLGDFQHLLPPTDQRRQSQCNTYSSANLELKPPPEVAR